MTRPSNHHHQTNPHKPHHTINHNPKQDWNTLLRMEEEYIEKMCAEIVAFHPDIVITEKGVSGA